MELLPMKMLTGQKGKEAVGNVKRILQYCQLLGRNSYY
jgi:hypothetical protein